MTVDETAKLELGRKWLAHISYDPAWTNEQLLEAVNREQPSPEARAAIIYALHHTGDQIIAEADALLHEGYEIEALIDRNIASLQDSAYMVAECLKALDREYDLLLELTGTLRDVIGLAPQSSAERALGCIESLAASQNKITAIAGRQSAVFALVEKLRAAAVPSITETHELSAA